MLQRRGFLGGRMGYPDVTIICNYCNQEMQQRGQQINCPKCNYVVVAYSMGYAKWENKPD